MSRLQSDFLLCPIGVAEKVPIMNHFPNLAFKSDHYLLLTNDEGYKLINATGIYINGYVLPRNQNFQRDKNLNPHKLVRKVYEDYFSEIGNFIKGIFIIIIWEQDVIRIYTDHLGLNKAFYFIGPDGLYLSNSLKYLKATGLRMEYDNVSISLQSLFHRVPYKYTVLKKIYKTSFGTNILLDGKEINIKNYFDPENLLIKKEYIPGLSYLEFADSFKENIKNFYEYLKPSDSLITLTGGKDSRTILTALLNLGKFPKSFTYGNDLSQDSIFARNVADAVGLSHYIINPELSINWIEEQAKKIVNINNPEINIHRSHRLFSFSELAKISDPDACCYTGYLGGELLMGIYPDNLIFTNFLLDFWRKRKIPKLRIRLADYFHKDPSLLEDSILERMNEFKFMNSQLSSDILTFYGIFDIGVLHHSQDVTLAKTIWKYPYPVFLDIDFLKLLFNSRFSFFNSSNNTLNLFKRYSLFELSMNMQHILFPALDKVHFGKKGIYNVEEYLKGPLYWSAIKGYRYLNQKKRYPPPFSYNEQYTDFLRVNFKTIISDKSTALSCFYETGKALNNLDSSVSLFSESQLHKYTNIVMFYLFENALINES